MQASLSDSRLHVRFPSPPARRRGCSWQHSHPGHGGLHSRGNATVLPTSLPCPLGDRRLHRFESLVPNDKQPSRSCRTTPPCLPTGSCTSANQRPLWTCPASCSATSPTRSGPRCRSFGSHVPIQCRACAGRQDACQIVWHEAEPPSVWLYFCGWEPLVLRLRFLMRPSWSRPG